MPPLNVLVVDAGARSDYDTWMKSFNKMRANGSFDSVAIMIRTPRDLARLKTCLILKRLLKINNFPEELHVTDFPIGTQILYPNLEDSSGYGEQMHVIDHKVAELFYISDFYYRAFQQVYHPELDRIEKLLEKQLEEQ